MPTAIVHHPVFEKHDTGPHHPETPERYRVTIDALRADHELWSDAIEIEADEARRSDIQACHTTQHFKHVAEAVREVLGQPEVPSFLEVIQAQPERVVVHVPVYTDIEDEDLDLADLVLDLAEQGDHLLLVARIRAERMDLATLLGDDAVLHEDGIALFDVGPILQDVILALDQGGEDLDRLIAELVWLLNNTCHNFAFANGGHRFNILIGRDNFHFPTWAVFEGLGRCGSIVTPKSNDSF